MLGTILIAGKGALAIDNIERTLGGAGKESPEERRFNWDPVNYAMQHRAELVQAVLMILRAYIVHVEDGGARAECTPFGDYVAWSRFVRGR
jgi:hypothetical protein